MSTRADQTARTEVRAVGLNAPGPTSADGIISSRGATNFSAPAARLISGAPWRAATASRAYTTTTGTPPASTPTTDSSATACRQESSVSRDRRHRTRRGVIEEPAESSRVLPAWRGTGTHSYSDGWAARGGPATCRSATAGFSGDRGKRRLLEEASRRTCCPTGLAAIRTTSCTRWRPLARRPSWFRSYAENDDPMALTYLPAASDGAGAAVHDRRANFAGPASLLSLGAELSRPPPKLRDWFLEQVRGNTVLREEQRRLTTSPSS